MPNEEPEPKWRKRLPIAFLVVIVFVVQLFEYRGWIAGPTGHLVDMFLRHGSSHPSDVPPRPVVVVEIGDDAYTDGNCFKETSPLDPDLLRELVAKVAEAHPPEIGIDILTESKIHIDDYRRMAETFRPISIVWAAGVRQAHVHTPGFFAWLGGVKDEIIADPTRVLGYEPGAPQLKPPYWAIPLFPRDDDATIRRLPMEVTISADVDKPHSGPPAPHWARLIASDYCAWLLRTNGYSCPARDSDEILIPYGGDQPLQFSMSQFFTCDAKAKTVTYRPEFQRVFEDSVKNRAVLIGGTFGSSGDFHDSPVGHIPGLLIDAYAIQAQVQGGEFYAIEQPWAWILDLIAGLAILLLYSESSIRKLFERLEHHGMILRPEVENRVVLLGGFVLRCLLLILFVIGYRYWGFHYLLGLVAITMGTILEALFHLADHAWLAGSTNSRHTGHSSRRGLHR